MRGGRLLPRPAAVTPGSSRTRRRSSSTNCARLAALKVVVSVSASRVVTALRVVAPVSVSRSLHTVRASRPVPTSSSTASASCAPTSVARRRRLGNPPAPGDRRSSVARSLRPAVSAGASPQTSATNIAAARLAAAAREIDRDRLEPRHRLGGDDGEGAQAEVRQPEAERRSDRREQRALEERRADETAAAGANRQPHREFTLPRQRAADEQRRDVRARHEQQQRTRRRQRPHHRPRRADHEVVEHSYRGPPAPAAPRHRRQRDARVLSRLLDRHAVAQPADQPEPTGDRPPPIPERPAPPHRNPQIHIVIRHRERRGHHGDDVVRNLSDAQYPADDATGGREPRRVPRADDDHARIVRLDRRDPLHPAWH